MEVAPDEAGGYNNHMSLEVEIKYFESHKSDLLKNHTGKFALIKGDQFIGAYDTMQAAFDEGIDKFGVVPFLIKQILEVEPIEKIPALTHSFIHANS